MAVRRVAPLTVVIAILAVAALVRGVAAIVLQDQGCLLYTSPSPRD